MQFIRNLITIIDTKNETIIPTINIISSMLVNPNPNLTSFNKLAPNIVGIAKQNVNSAAFALDNPISNPPMMVAPDLDVPGKIAAIS